MPENRLSVRVTVLEQRVDRVETAIADFRAETAASFDAVHQALTRMQAQINTLETQQKKDFEFLNSRLESRFESLNTRISVLHEDVIARIAMLQTQQKTDFESVNTRMSVLHEDVIARIATLGELWTPRRPGRRKKR